MNYVYLNDTEVIKCLFDYHLCLFLDNSLHWFSVRIIFSMLTIFTSREASLGKFRKKNI